MQGRARQGRGTAEFQNHQKKPLFQGLGSSKCWFWNCSKPGHGRAARAEQAGQERSRVPKPQKKTLFQGLGSSKCWFWNCRKLDGIYLRVMVRSAFKMYTGLSGGKYISYATCSVKKFPRPWNCNVVFLT